MFVQDFQLPPPSLIPPLEEETSDAADRFCFGHQIGSGSSCTIYEVSDRQKGNQCCCKVVSKQFFNQSEEKTGVVNIDKEALILNHLHHKNIVEFIDFMEDENNYYLFEEFCEGVTLLDFINEQFIENGRIDDKAIAKIMEQILEALSYLSEMHVAHRDIKLENIIVNPENLDVKLIDFGFAEICMNGENLNSFCGSLFYTSPEILMNQPYNGYKADIWSTGIIFFTMLIGKLPYSSFEADSIIQTIVNDKIDIPISVAPKARKLITRMLDVDQLKRITVDEALKQDYFETEALPKLEIPKCLKVNPKLSHSSMVVNKAKTVHQKRSFNTKKNLIIPVVKTARSHKVFTL